MNTKNLHIFRQKLHEKKELNEFMKLMVEYWDVQLESLFKRNKEK